MVISSSLLLVSVMFIIKGVVSEGSKVLNLISAKALNSATVKLIILVSLAIRLTHNFPWLNSFSFQVTLVLWLLKKVEIVSN